MVHRINALELNLNFHESKGFLSTDPDVNLNMNRKSDQIEFAINNFESASGELQENLNSFFVKNQLNAIPVLNRSIARFEGNLIAPASYAQPILDFLIELKKEFGDTFVISGNDLNSLISALVKRGHLTGAQGIKYCESIPTEMKLSELAAFVGQSNNVLEAIALAKIYNESDSHVNKKQALEWLLRANIFNPNAFATAVQNANLNLNDFFSTFTTLENPRIFSKEGELLLSALAKSDSLTKVSLCGRTSYLNKYFADFIAKSRSIKVLDLSLGAEVRTDLDILALTNGLCSNQSIEELSLADTLIGDDKLCFLLDSLKCHRQSQLRKLDLSCCDLTDKGAQAVIDYVAGINTTLRTPMLESINLYSNHFSEQYIQKINEMNHNDQPNNNVGLRSKGNSESYHSAYSRLLFNNANVSEKRNCEPDAPCNQFNRYDKF